MAGEDRIILTRERDGNRIWAERLEKAGRPVLLLPLVRYAPLPAPANRGFGAWDWILFTSPQGVRAFAALAPDLGEAQLGALGHGTAAAVTAAGWHIAFNGATLDGAEFATAFNAAVSCPCRVLLPGPKRRMPAPREILAAAGHEVTELPLYVTVPMPAAEIAAAELAGSDIVFFCSPSAVRAFAAARDDEPRCVAIGLTTAEACRKAGFDPAVADTPDLDAMLRAAGLEPLAAPTPEPVQPEREP